MDDDVVKCFLDSVQQSQFVLEDIHEGLPDCKSLTVWWVLVLLQTSPEWLEGLRSKSMILLKARVGKYAIQSIGSSHFRDIPGVVQAKWLIA